MMKGTPIEPIELAIVKKMQRSVTFVPASAQKRFINTLSERSMLTDKGRAFLAFCAQRYRRQWRAAPEELAWIASHLQSRQPIQVALSAMPITDTSVCK